MSGVGLEPGLLGIWPCLGSLGLLGVARRNCGHLVAPTGAQDEGRGSGVLPGSRTAPWHWLSGHGSRFLPLFRPEAASQLVAAQPEPGLGQAGTARPAGHGPHLHARLSPGLGGVSQAWAVMVPQMRDETSKLVLLSEARAGLAGETLGGSLLFPLWAPGCCSTHMWVYTPHPSVTLP